MNHDKMTHAKKNLHQCEYGCCGEVRHKKNNEKIFRSRKRSQKQKIKRDMQLDLN